MIIKWLGHASFLITSDSGIKIITDPYTSGSDIGYRRIDEIADIVTVSHSHFDHNGVSQLPGKFDVVQKEGMFVIKGIQFKGIATYHDEAKGKMRGNNIIYCFTVDNIKFCHLGDLGHRLSKEQIGEIGAVDVLFIPVGGNFTIDAAVATEVCTDLKPCIVIPMHYKTPKIGIPIATVDNFIKGKDNVKLPKSSELVLEKNKLPYKMEIIVLEPAF